MPIKNMRMLNVLKIAVILLPVFDARAATLPFPAYTITDLGVLQDGQSWSRSLARDINDFGQVVGYSSGVNGNDKAFIWSNGRMMDIDSGGTPGYTGFSYATAVNNSGQVVGDRFGGGTWAALFSNGTATPLGTLGGAKSFSYDINSSGQIVGMSDLVNSSPHAFQWQNGVMLDLGVLDYTVGYSYSSANAINDRGQIVGQSRTRDGYFGVIWDNSGPQVINLGLTPGANSSSAVDINNFGQVLLNANGGSGFQSHAVVWSDEGYTDIGGLGFLGLNYTNAYAINDSGQVVGDSYISPTTKHAFVWDKDHGMSDLNSFLDSVSGVNIVLTEARGINATGQIVANGVVGGSEHAFLLTPKDVQGIAFDDPVLPSGVVSNQFVFLNPQSGLWYDPPLAVGFEYELIGVGEFLQITVPPEFFGLSVVVDGVVVDSDLDAGESFIFGGGVKKFTLLGIMPMVDVENFTSFPTFLRFSGDPAELRMTAILPSGNISIDEPASLVMMVLGVFWLATKRENAVKLAIFDAQ